MNARSEGMDPRLARYPFLPAAAEAAARAGLSLETVLGDWVYASARRRGAERVRLALEDAALPARPLPNDPRSPELLEEAISYVYARILVSALGDAYVVRRHALAEAVRVKEHLEREDDVYVVRECALAVGLDFEPEGALFKAHFSEYLKQAVHLKDMEWKLVRQPLRGGVVEMERKTAARLIQEALRRRIEAELPRPVSDEVKARVEPDLKPLRELAAAKKERYSMEGAFGKVDLAILPPCMQHILGQLHRGENVAHNARFAIVTFLHKIGMTSEDIMRLFAQAPDFREDLTRYQVEHITGVSSGTTYSVPGCDNLQTFNLCYADDLCRTTTRGGKSRVLFATDYYRLMHEAADEVEKLGKVVPLANPKVLVDAAARRFPLLLRIRDVTAHPDFERLDGQLLANLSLARRHPIEVVGEPGSRQFKLDAGQPFAMTDLLAEPWVSSALRPRSVATSPPTTLP